MNQSTKTIRDKYNGTICTLDGKPAKICASPDGFASVGHLNGPLALDWSWEAVQRIVDTKQGQFKS